ncbi:NAD(P)-dependent oxidoreductase [Pelagovum pacificum]|uniref:NAD(P)-dependent oxidoreductase n=1 Tax=Pelagovum pacificum TaxID=2588711 RepID=A0A5C5GG63_9RHOB|nr:NAD(P)-dependent oxidoreductase [Pelagovum pacificum]QQA43813.1 NAD(P)-dependent oxidoreductase [Pelagovum pacificum]TNY33057.1 NAD(P)-dependent oxidoreductase [Pelagovum pacificum]
MRITFIGAGLMGTGMALNLAREHEVEVILHRNREPESRLRDGGVSIAAEARTSAATADAVFLCLPNADVVRAVVDDLSPALRPGTLVVDTTTSLPKATRDIAATLADRDVAFIDAPVTGIPVNAENGDLVSMVGATGEAFSKVKPLLGLTSKAVHHFGPPGAGHAAKLINNFITQGQAALTIEAMRRCEAVGIDRDQMVEVISNSGSRSGTFMMIMPSVVAGSYDGLQFSLANAIKDVRYVESMFESSGAPSDLSSELVRFFTAQLDGYAPETHIPALLKPKP